MYEEISDYELLDHVAENEIATETLFQKYKPLIISLAKKTYYYNQNSGLEINDLIQEGMIGFTVALNTYDKHKQALFFTYAKTCIIRRMMTTITSANRLKHQLLNESISVDNLEKEVGLLDKLFSDYGSNPENKIIDDENTKELLENIRKDLTNFEGQVFELKISGLNNKEIAQILEKDYKSIDNALSRIKNKVLKYIN